jgi:tetratricopeptide (TPR) repeat protein
MLKMINSNFRSRWPGSPITATTKSVPVIQRPGLRFAICVALFGMTWAVFGQTLGFQFVNYDDPIYVIENAHIRAGLSWHGVGWAFTHIHSQNWHPLTTISHMLDCQLFGLQSSWHHFVNVLLHSVAAVLLFFALEKMTTAMWTSAFVAAVFAIHPLRVESVAWISERKDVLSGVFFMLTLIAYVGWVRRPSIGRYLTMSILLACGLMSKPMLVTMPIVLVILDYWPLNRGQKSEARGQQSAVSGQWSVVNGLVLEKTPLFGLSVLSIVATLWAQNLALGSTQHLPLQWRVTNAVVSYVDYIRQMFWPVDLVPFYVHLENRLSMLRLLTAVMMLIAITAIAFARRRKNPYILVGWLWYVVILVPVIGLVQVGLQARADRYTYLPQIGLYIALMWLICDLTKSWRQQGVILGAGAAIVLAALSILSWKQATHWRDSEALWTHALAITPDSDVAHAGLAGILFVRGQTDAAIEHYQRALELRDGNVAAHYGLALALARDRKVDAAIAHFQQVLSIQPDNLQASNYLGALFASKGDVSNAIGAWRQTLSFDPDNADAANNLAWVLATSSDAQFRDGKEALDLAQRAIQYGGENPSVLRTRAAALAENNQFTEAVETAERAERLAEASGDKAMAETLRQCEDLFRRNEPLHNTQVSH